VHASNFTAGLEDSDIYDLHIGARRVNSHHSQPSIDLDIV
jgi:hypothetical protein